jgi:hypothetical protein
VFHAMYKMNQLIVMQLGFWPAQHDSKVRPTP